MGIQCETNKQKNKQTDKRTKKYQLSFFFLIFGNQGTLIELEYSASPHIVPIY